MNELRLFLWLAAFVFVALSIAGGVIGYSPVPFWDMWAGVDFVSRASKEGLVAWWAQHNEHRIVLSRALFWVDLACFRGEGWFLILMNYVLAATAVALFCQILRERLASQSAMAEGALLVPLTIVILSSWLQNENLTWGFQSQFFLANLLPLLAFLLLHWAQVRPDNSMRLFAFACLAGVASLGSMANGLLTLPLMTFMALTLRIGRTRTLVLAVLSVCGAALYLHGYRSPPGHGAPIETLQHDPLGLVQFALVYLGGPFFHAAGHLELVAAAAGLALICLAALAAWRSRSTGGPDSLQWALLMYLVYVIATAFATAGGRLRFGTNAALAGRYQTPVLMAWTALLSLYAPQLAGFLRRRPVRAGLLAALVPVSLLPAQLHALDSKEDILFRRLVAALALELGVRDEERVATIFPSLTSVLPTATAARQNGASIFGNPELKGARDLIGLTDSLDAPRECVGNWDELTAIPGEDRYVRVSGWAFDPVERRPPKRLHVVGSATRTVGYALTGQPRGDVAAAVDARASTAGFEGYILKEHLGESLVIKGLDPDCRLRVVAPTANGSAVR